MSQAVKRHVTMFCLARSPAAQADLKFTCRASGGLELLILLIHIFKFCDSRSYLAL